MTASQVNSSKNANYIIWPNMINIISFLLSIYSSLFLLKRSQLCWQYAEPETKMANGCTLSNHLVSCGKSKENKQQKSSVCEAMDQKSVISNF